MAIRVVNKYKHTPTLNDFYIGRGSPLGNPYTSNKKLENTKARYQAGSREESISLHKVYLNDRIEKGDEKIIDALNDIISAAMEGDVNLCCFCSPLGCHGDYIKEICDAAVAERLKQR